MKILICGSRDWTDYTAIYQRITQIYDQGGATILHGDAKGADQIAARFAHDFAFRVHAYPADWAKHGRRAGILRNHRMLDQNPDLVIAFQINGSRGTQHTINEARRRGIPVEIHTQPAAVQPLFSDAREPLK